MVLYNSSPNNRERVFSRNFLPILLVTLLVSCEKKQEEPLRLVPEGELPLFEDDLPLEGLEEAVERQLSYFESSAPSDYPSPHPAFDRESLRETLALILSYIKKKGGGGTLDDFIRKNFDLYKAAGQDGRGTVLFTGYFVPVLEGNREPTSRYRYPLYGRPDDMVRVDLGLFGDDWKGRRLRGRVEEGRVYPYYSREEIDGGTALEKRHALLWVDDYVDLFFVYEQSDILCSDASEIVGDSDIDVIPAYIISRWQKGEVAFGIIKNNKGSI